MAQWRYFMSNELKKLIIDVTTGEQSLVDLSVEEISQMETDHNKFLEIENNYVVKRVREYPSIADQLDTIYHEGIDAWKATIAAVKQEYPKP